MKDKEMTHKEIWRETTLDKIMEKRYQLDGATKVKHQQEETIKRLCFILERHTKMIVGGKTLISSGFSIGSVLEKSCR